MVTISQGTLKKLFILYFISQFEDGVYEEKRLHKLIYFSTRKGRLCPFTFKKHYYGQFSEDLRAHLEQLISMGFIKVLPLKNKQGNKYTFLGSNELKRNFGKVVKKEFPEIKKTIDKIVQNYGYLPTADIVARAYNLPEMKNKKLGDILLQTNLLGKIAIKKLEPDDSLDLEICMNPDFIAEAENIINSTHK